jgi:hypothetical protein
MYVCIYVCYVCTRMYKCTYVWMYVCYVCMYKCTYVWMHVMYVVCINLRIYVCM